MNELFKKIIEDYFEKWIGVVIALFVSFIFYVCMKQRWQSMENGDVYTKIFFLMLLVINIIYDVHIFKNYYIPRAAKNKIGLMVNIDAENSNVYKETKRKFGEEFKKYAGKEFDVIFVPIEKKIYYKKNEQFIKLIHRKRCILYLRITVNTNSGHNEIRYNLQVGATILHARYEENVKESFQKEFDENLDSISQHMFSEMESFEMMRMTAEKLSLVCSYVMGLSFFLNGDLSRSQEVLTELHQLLKRQNNESKIIKKVECLLYDIFMTKAMIYSQVVLFNPGNIRVIKSMDECVKEANRYIPNTSSYYLNRAYCDVALDRIEDAKNAINMCKQLCQESNSKEQRWKYSDAFLCAYENKSLTKIVQAYSRALKVKYDLQDLIIYIEMIVKNRPEKIGLYLALGILYEENGDIILAKENYDIYIEQQENKMKTLEILKKKGKYSFD